MDNNRICIGMKTEDMEAATKPGHSEDEGEKEADADYDTKDNNRVKEEE